MSSFPDDFTEWYAAPPTSIRDCITILERVVAFGRGLRDRAPNGIPGSDVFAVVDAASDARESLDDVIVYLAQQEAAGVAQLPAPLPELVEKRDESRGKMWEWLLGNAGRLREAMERIDRTLKAERRLLPSRQEAWQVDALEGVEELESWIEDGPDEMRADYLTDTVESWARPLLPRVESILGSDSAYALETAIDYFVSRLIDGDDDLADAPPTGFTVESFRAWALRKYLEQIRATLDAAWPGWVAGDWTPAQVVRRVSPATTTGMWTEVRKKREWADEFGFEDTRTFDKRFSGAFRGTARAYSINVNAAPEEYRARLMKWVPQQARGESKGREGA